MASKTTTAGAAPLDDSDLEDLMGKSPKETEMVKLNSSLDALSGSSGSFSPFSALSNVTSLCAYSFPRLSKCLCILLIFGGLALVSNYWFNPIQKMGIFGDDFSVINNAYDLSLSKVDHWCIRGDNDSCRCEDPLQPTSRAEFKSWNAAHKANVAEVKFYRTLFGQDPTIIDENRGKARPSIDVAFVGESVVEAMDGRWLGKKISRSRVDGDGRKPDIGKVFEKLFNKDKGGPVEGVALGISGDNCANVLWRIQHDEMPYDFNPKVWWLVLGMNDLTRLQCSEEIVVLGVLRVAEEIKLRKADAKIVINSLLPMIDYQRIDAKKGEQPPGPKLEDFADFKAEKDGAREGQVIKDAKKEFENKGGGRRASRHLRLLRERKRKERSGKGEKQESGGKSGKDSEAAMEKAMERKRKYLEARDKRLKDRKFRDNEKYRPKRPVSPLLPMIKKKVLPPVWPAVHVINAKLKEFCRNHESISFFDATQIFTRDEGRGRHSLHSELISPRGHPTEIGFAVWQGQIMHRLHKMLVIVKPKERPIFNQMDEEEPEQPDIVKPAPNGSPDIDEEKEGEGVEHVSNGKSAEPPKPENEAMPDQKDDSPEIDEEEEAVQPPQQETTANNEQKLTRNPPEKENTNVSLNKEKDANEKDETEEDSGQKEETEKVEEKTEEADEADKQKSSAATLESETGDQIPSTEESREDKTTSSTTTLEGEQEKATVITAAAET